MRIMAAHRQPTVLRKIEETDADFVPGPALGGRAARAEGQADVAWPCNDTKYIVQFPEERAIWSYGSGYGGNALLGKKCYALRIASVMARDEGWLAEHMLILKLTPPERHRHATSRRRSRAPAARPTWRCWSPTIPGWKVETLGDDIAWMRFGEDGRLYAVNPEHGFFGVAPGTNQQHQPQRDEDHRQAATRSSPTWRSPRTATSGGRAWRTRRPRPPPGRASRGPRRARSSPATPTAATAPRSSSAPSSPRSTTTPGGVPIDAILFGGRRKTTVPLVTEARDWTHGTFIGATLSSETTAAATGAVGVVRRDPMAMLPFIGYNAGDYLGHWINLGKEHDAGQDAQDLLRQLVPPRRGRRASCGRASARTAGC